MIMAAYQGSTPLSQREGKGGPNVTRVVYKVGEKNREKPHLGNGSTGEQKTEKGSSSKSPTARLKQRSRSKTCLGTGRIFPKCPGVEKDNQMKGKQLPQK